MQYISIGQTKFLRPLDARKKKVKMNSLYKKLQNFFFKVLLEVHVFLKSKKLRLTLFFFLFLLRKVQAI